jgi:cytidylate kinase
MIVTIDGPAGSGKSTAAKRLADRLGYDFLDTGAMFRAVAVAAIRDGIEPQDSDEFRCWLSGLRLEASPTELRLDGEVIAPRIRTPAISAMASQLAVLPSVRSLLADLQRSAAQGKNLVTEGRDQGTVVFPYAECKLFLTADRLVRARRRHSELLGQGHTAPLEDVLAGQDERDRRDSEREVAPLKPAPDAIIIDTSNLTFDEVVARMETEVRRCGL